MPPGILLGIETGNADVVGLRLLDPGRLPGGCIFDSETLEVPG